MRLGMFLRKEIFLIITLYLAKTSPEFSSVENEVVIDLNEYFQTSFCVFVTEDNTNGISLSRNGSFPSRRNVMTSVMNFRQVEACINDETVGARYGGPSLFVLKKDEQTMTELKQLSHNPRFSSVKWIMFSDNSLDSKAFQGIYIPFDCEFVYINPSDSLFLMTEMYRIDESSGIETFNFGYWKKGKGLDATSVYFYERRNNLKGKTFKATIMHNPPYSYVIDRGSRIEFQGYSYEVWRELEYRLNFRTEYPMQFINKTPEDVLMNEDIPFAVGSIVYDAVAANQVDLSEPIYESKIYLFGHRPGSELEWNSYLKPFSTRTWYVNLGWMIISSIALSIIYKLAWEHGGSESDAPYYIFTVVESFCTVFRAMCMQGSDVAPRSNSCRLLFLSIYLTALVVTSAFSAALFSLLTIPVSKAPFYTYDDVIYGRGYRLGIIPDTDIYRGLEHLATRYPKSDHDRLMKSLESKSKLPKTVMEGLERVCKYRRYVFMWDKPNVLDQMQNMTRKCQDFIMPSAPVVFKEHISFAMKKGNPYKGLIDLHIVQMKNEGILKRLLMNYWPPGIPTVQTSWVLVTLSDISPILYMFCIGLGLSLVLFILENIRGCITKMNNRKNGTESGKNRYFWQNVKNAEKLSQNSPSKSKWEVQSGNYTKWDNGSVGTGSDGATDGTGEKNQDDQWEKNYSNQTSRDQWTK